MLAIQHIRVYWTKQSKNIKYQEKRKELLDPVLIEDETVLDGEGVFFTQKECWQYSAEELKIIEKYREKENDKQEKFRPFTGKDERKEAYLRFAAANKKARMGEFFDIKDVNRLGIPCVRIIEESGAYRVKWFSDSSIDGKPFRHGGNEDSNDPDSDLYMQMNTLNETAFVLHKGESGVLSYNFRSSTQFDMIHYYQFHKVYLVNTDKLTREIFIRDYDYSYQQIAKLY